MIPTNFGARDAVVVEKINVHRLICEYVAVVAENVMVAVRVNEVAATASAVMEN